MSLLGWGVVMFGVWVALNVVLYGILDRDARNTRKDGSGWLLGEGIVMIHEGTPFHVALITIVVMMLLWVVIPGFVVANWVDLRRRRAARGFQD
jgi:hypothetical protein